MGRQDAGDLDPRSLGAAGIEGMLRAEAEGSPHHLRRQLAGLRSRDVDAAYRLVAEAATSVPSAEQVADVLLAAARRLTESDTAYLAVPVDDEFFAFSRTLGVRTSEFRKLRVGMSEGIGSLARAEGTPIRSVDYLDDERFSRQMREITKREGIRSAIAVPLINGDEVTAVLYVAHHERLGYQRQDEDLLKEYSAAVNLSLGAANVAQQQQEFGRLEERRLLARGLHDRVGRPLTRLLHLTSRLDELDHVQHPALKDDLSSAVAELAQSVRQEVEQLLVAGQPDDTSLAALAAEICQVPRVSGLRRDVRLLSRPGVSDYDAVIPGRVADALRSVAQEAVFNSELHSKGSHCAITIACDADGWRLTVEDDGVGFGGREPDAGHYGLKLMADAMRKVQGSVTVEEKAGAGVRVDCWVPVEP